jgi:hypothetical protein
MLSLMLLFLLVLYIVYLLIGWLRNRWTSKDFSIPSREFLETGIVIFATAIWWPSYAIWFAAFVVLNDSANALTPVIAIAISVMITLFLGLPGGIWLQGIAFELDNVMNPPVHPSEIVPKAKKRAK